MHTEANNVEREYHSPLVWDDTPVDGNTEQSESCCPPSSTLCNTPPLFAGTLWLKAGSLTRAGVEDFEQNAR